MPISKSKKVKIPPHKILTGADDPLESLLRRYLEDFVAHNQSAHTLANGLQVVGIGFRPIIDHITFRTLDVEKRAKEFISYGYQYDLRLGVIQYENWWAKVYRKQGYPTIFIDQAFEGKRGAKSLIPDWVKTFGDKTLHHVAVQVDDIENPFIF